jgi:glycosyltransferase involved in cell wall biosynthesis
MNCSIVIRAYNESSHIERLLIGIREQSIKKPEIILVDSGSTDGTVEIALKYGVKVLSILPEDFTFGRSLNTGIAAASHQYIVIASAHVYPVFPDWLEKLIEPFSDPSVALTYGMQRGNESSQFSEQQIFRQWFPLGSASLQKHPFCNNANAAIRRSIWDQNPYSEILPALEDIDWANRIINQGYSLRYVPEAEIIHVHNETPKVVFNRYLREGMAFKRIFQEERFGLLDLVRLVTGNILTDLGEAKRQKQFLAHYRDIIWFRWSQFWGTYQGYRRSGPLTWQLRQRFYYPKAIDAQHTRLPRGVSPIKYNHP